MRSGKAVHRLLEYFGCQFHRSRLELLHASSDGTLPSFIEFNPRNFSVDQAQVVMISEQFPQLAALPQAAVGMAQPSGQRQRLRIQPFHPLPPLMKLIRFAGLFRLRPAFVGYLIRVRITAEDVLPSQLVEIKLHNISLQNCEISLNLSPINFP